MPNEPVTSPGPHVDIFRPSESPITDLASLEKNITQSLLYKAFRKVSTKGSGVLWRWQGHMNLADGRIVAKQLI